MATLKKTSKQSPTERLLAALRGENLAEAQQAPPAQQAPKQSVKRARKRGEADIRHPKGSRALRQHIAAIQAEGTPRPRLQLRMKEGPARGLVAGRGELHVLARDVSSSGRKRSAAFIARDVLSDGKSSEDVIAVQDLGKLVRDTRESRSLTQAQVAKKAGTGRRFISDFEGGKESVEFGKVLRVCRALGLSLTASGTPDGQ